MAQAKAAHKEDLDDLEKRLEELRRKFDLYFVGSKEQRIPPAAAQAKLGGELRRQREEEVRNWNTQDKFRFNQIFSRFVSLDRHWARTCKQIEDGTHKRDKFKVQQMKKREGEVEEPAPRAKENRVDSLDDLDVDVSNFDDFSGLAPPRAAEKVPLAPPRSAPKPPSSPSAPIGMSDQRLQQLYDVYMQAKKRTGESSTLTIDVLKKQIEKQIPAIKAKHKCEQVDFKVVLKDGKAILKAIPK